MDEIQNKLLDNNEKYLKTLKTKFSKQEDEKFSWTTLIHKGPLFPPEYEPLPANTKFYYNKKPMVLSSNKFDKNTHLSPEEAGVLFAKALFSDHNMIEKGTKEKKSAQTKNIVFRNNFFKDWRKIIENVMGKKYSDEYNDLDKINFNVVINYLDDLKKQSETKEYKKEKKEKAEELKKEYGYALIDGEKVKIGAYTIQPPGLLTGSHKSPDQGKIKGRVLPSDITINISKGHEPKCRFNGKPCEWKEIVQNRDDNWLVAYPNALSGKRTYIYLDRNESRQVASSDKEKFDKARVLKKNLPKIRKEYKNDLTSESKTTKQLATAVYLLDELAIRPGTDAEEDTNTKGLTTLTIENFKFLGDNKIILDFVGKSSIEFKKEFVVSPQVYKNLKEFADKPDNQRQIFSLIDANNLNKYIKSLLPGEDITAKVFRTCKASSILQSVLDEMKIPPNAPLHKKKEIFEKANTKTALKLNHKRLTNNPKMMKTLEEKLEKAQEKLKEARTEKQTETAEKQITEIETRINNEKGQIATGTSKINYIDPRIVVAWCKKNEIPIDKIYAKTQLSRFIWAMPIEMDWKF